MGVSLFSVAKDPGRESEAVLENAGALATAAVASPE
jgi:hypothetical protein